MSVQRVEWPIREVLVRVCGCDLASADEYLAQAPKFYDADRLFADCERWLTERAWLAMAHV